MVKKSISRKVKRRTAARKAARQPREWGVGGPPRRRITPVLAGGGRAKIENSSGSPPLSITMHFQPPRLQLCVLDNQ